MKANSEYLFKIQQDCISNNAENYDQVAAWLEEIGLEPGAFEAFAATAGEGAEMAAGIAQILGAPPADFLSAVFASGFEVGVRYQQSREVII